MGTTIEGSPVGGSSPVGTNDNGSPAGVVSPMGANDNHSPVGANNFPLTFPLQVYASTLDLQRKSQNNAPGAYDAAGSNRKPLHMTEH